MGGVCHLDIKPANIVINDEDGQAKLVDFGFARHTKRLIRKPCGTLPYIAPEVLSGMEYDGTAADVWSIGSTMLDILYGLGALARALGWKESMVPSQTLGAALSEQLKEAGSVPLWLDTCLG